MWKDQAKLPFESLLTCQQKFYGRKARSNPSKSVHADARYWKILCCVDSNEYLHYPCSDNLTVNSRKQLLIMF